MGFKPQINGVITGAPVHGTTLEVYTATMTWLESVGIMDLISSGAQIQIVGQTGIALDVLDVGDISIYPHKGDLTLMASGGHVKILDLPSTPGHIVPAGFSGTKTIDGVEVPYI